MTKLFVFFDAHRYIELLSTANRLRSLQTSVTDTYQVSISTTLTISLSALSRWNEARIECKHAIQITAKTTFDYERLELLGELAWIDWNVHSWQQMFESFYELVHDLLKLHDPANPRFREVFNKTGHALGWYIMMAHFGKPPTRTQSNEEYAPVFSGLFGRSNRRIGEHVSPGGVFQVNTLDSIEFTCTRHR